MNQPMKYRKRPVVIEAMRFPDRYPACDDEARYAANRDAHAVYMWVESNTLGSFEPMDVIEGRKPWPASGITIDPRDGRMIIATLEGGHWVDPGDYVIRGVAREFYPCKPSIFAATYEVAE